MGCLDRLIRPLVFILPKITRCVNTFKFEDKDKNNKLISFV